MSSSETLLNNRYRLVSQLASGGMAVVYKATDESLGRTVAIKILRPSLTADPAFIIRFQNEARSIANLSHPNIVTVHDVGSDGPTYFIVMELVDGSDLKKVIRTHNALPLERVMNLSIQICEGIGFAHRAGIVHADVKPQNVLLTKSDIVKITDFGIAQALSDTQPAERASVVWGSPHYFAPEQAQGEKPTAAADVYSIGVVMFEMLSGRLPYTGGSQQELAMAHIQTEVPDVRQYNPAVPEELASLVRKLMKKKPNDRYKHAGQIAEILKSFRGQVNNQTMRQNRPPAVSPEERTGQPPRPTNLPGKSQPQPSSIPPPPEALPTQRYSVAPDAPYSEPSRTPPPPGESSMQGVQHPRAFTRPPRNAGATSDSQRLAPSQPYRPQYEAEEEDVFRLDGVTIALGVLAFMAVACLIPLYIVALQAQLG
jgi:eukaryotic-like serine/threonine-protein kinase